jgi:hypothetical protein
VPYAAEAVALTRILTDLFRRHLPDPLAQTSDNWGQQEEVRGNRRRIKDWHIVSEPYEYKRNQGLWRRLTLRVPDRQCVHVGVRDIQFPRRGCLQGTILTVVEEMKLQLEQQHWCHGVRLYSCDIRAHCKVGLTLFAQVTSQQAHSPTALLPNYIFTVRVYQARLDYDRVVVDHIMGLDGQAAKIAGDTIREIVRRFKPDLEEQLRQRAEAAIVRVTDNRQLHLTLDDWLRRVTPPYNH